MKPRKKELLIFFLLLVIAAAALIGLHIYRSSKDYGSIRVWALGEEYGVYSLGKDQRIEINGTNVCEIKDGTVRMVEANCPDQLCMYQPEIGADGGLIICLPNGILIEGIPVGSGTD